VTGLWFEARIAAGEGVIVVCSSNRRTLVASLTEAITQGCSGIISFGTAGGLVPDLVPGSWIVGTGVLTGRERFPTDLAWSRRLKETLPHAMEADIVGTDMPVADPAAKRMLHEQTGAAAVDMESDLAAQVASVRRLPFAALRVIIDPVDQVLPTGALAGLRPNGTPHVAAVLASVLRSPSQLPALIRIARDAHLARTALLHGRRLLGMGLAFPDFS
jgi:hopanoid-associated phosphorylase